MSPANQGTAFQELCVAFQKGRPHFEQRLRMLDLSATIVSGARLNCLLHTFLQHATKKYDVKEFDDSIIRDIKIEAGINPDDVQMRANDIQETLNILKAINKKFNQIASLFLADRLFGITYHYTYIW